MKKFRGAGDTVQDAVEKILKMIDAREDEYELEILQKPHRGFFGLGKKEAVVEITLNERYVERKMKEFLDRLFSMANFQINYDITVSKKSATVCFTKIDGKMKKSKHFFQELHHVLSIYVNRFTSSKFSLKFEFQGEDLERIRKIAQRMAMKVLKSKGRVELTPMFSHERKVVHEVVKEYEGLTSYSVGYEPYRRVVIEYAGELKKQHRGGSSSGVRRAS
ncbi:MAG: Jag N-terminal domain-containing protein [Thermotogae bacterium]|nr:Jag N-terminal domain-containing protein [Thermotogota bacterium]